MNKIIYLRAKKKKMSSGLFKNVTNKLFVPKSDIFGGVKFSSES